MLRTSDAPEDQRLAAAVLRLNGSVLGIALGLAGGLILFLATIILVARGGETVGAHLGLLSQFLPGYDTTWAGSFIGGFYGTVLGFAVGWVMAWIYNRIVLFRTS